jgi:hypothetical protein
LAVARGWGRNEEDLAAEKEQAREARSSAGGSRADAQREALQRGLRLSLARVEEQLAATQIPARRKALEAARADLTERLASL